MKESEIIKYFYIFVLIFGILFLNSALAADKSRVEIDCSGGKAILACAKFDSGHCVDSILTFNPAEGKYITPPKLNIDLLFDTPTIADELSCDSAKTKSAFIVRYSTGACEYDACMHLEYFELNGRRITGRGNSKAIQNFFGDEARSQKIGPSVSLREDGK